jgi:tRNA(Ile)-lysidine synthase
MHELAERVLRVIRKQGFVRAGDRVAVAVSGGADSVALLLLLGELCGEVGILLSVAHVNHQLRGAESDEDARFVAELAARLGLELDSVEAPVGVDEAGVLVKSGLEATAREARYQYFGDLARAGRATKIATAHTLDDQAETVLLRMFRGTGIRGLAGIHPRLRLDADKKLEPQSTQRATEETARLPGSRFTRSREVAEVVRPLLGFRREELRAYLRERGQAWREDSSNADVAFLRNRVRARLIPMIAEEFGEAAIEHIAELAEIARAEEENWAVTPVLSAQLSVLSQGAAPALPVERLLALPLAAARRVVRGWIEGNAPEAGISFRLIEEILELARGTAGKKVELPGAAGAVGRRTVRRGRNELVLETEESAAGDYQYLLPVPGEIAVPELGIGFEARMVEVEDVSEQERGGLLDPAQVGDKVVIRNWRAGDRYWPAHRSGEKKVKELLSDRHAIGALKRLWPVAEVAGELVWMRGFAVPEAWRVRAGKAIWIRETARLM